MRFEIEVELGSSIFIYTVAFEFPKGFRELRVYTEQLLVDGVPIFARDTSHVRLTRAAGDAEANFRVDWHLVALPIIQRFDESDPLNQFRQWLANALILRPVPKHIRGGSDTETLQPTPELTDFGAWFSGVLSSAPSAYTKIDHYLKQVMPDFLDLKNAIAGKEARSLTVQFSNKLGRATIDFEDLSDGEKCFMIFALVIAANDAYGPLLCFWDEPDNSLAPAEVGASMIALRRAFEHFGQLIVSSHNAEVIRHFSDENTLVLSRNSHLEPSVVRLLEDVRDSGEFVGNVVEAIIRGDLGYGSQ
jgi:hypothetical protein